jgi:hypothetical protein
MNFRDRQNILELFHFHRFSKTSIGRLYGVSRQRITVIINSSNNTTFTSDDDCLLCDIDEALTYYIDGNEENKDPQNKIQLCEPHKRKFQHLQINKKVAESKIKPQY